ncbi:hypothetical protein PTTG_05627, partial [Puccinia triticina 1-1 BBBD Race 1]
MDSSQDSGSSRKMVKIKPQDRSLKFSGMRVEAFLRQYELAANLDGASDKDKMIERWGQVDAVRYTVADLQALRDSWTAKGGISTLDAFWSFKSVFNIILSYLIWYQHLTSEDLAVNHFFFSFSPAFQQRIKSYLVKEKKMVKTLDGRYRLPVLSELRAAVKYEMEEEVAFTSEHIKPAPVAVSSSEFKAANDIMQKMEDDGRPKDAQALDKAPATVDEISKMLQSFEQRLKKKFVMKGAPSTPGAPRESRGPLVCYYCHCEGHGTGRCMELVKDKEANLVEQKGNNFFLPNGALIPFDSSRPIRHVVASFQPKSAAASTSAEFRTTCGTLDPWYLPAISSQLFSSTYESDPARKKHEVPKPFKAPMVPPSAAQKPVKKAAAPPVDSDVENMDEEPELFERSPAAPLADPIPQSTDSLESPSKSKPPVQKVRFERAISKDQPHVIDDMIKKVSNLPDPGVTVRELLAISPAMAEGWKKWVTKRRVEAGTEELRTASGTLLAEGPDPEGPGADSQLYSCPLGFLPCLIGDEESAASPMIDSGSQLNLISNALANKFNISPRVNFSSAVYGIANQSCKL